MATKFVNTEQFSLEGFDELDKTLGKLLGDFGEKDTRKIMVKAARAAMKPVLETAKQLAPIDEEASTPGSHIKIPLRIQARKPTKKDKKSKYIKKGDSVIAVVSTVHKGVANIAQEFGTKEVAAQPYLRPALQQNVNQVVDILKTELSKAIEDKYKI